VCSGAERAAAHQSTSRHQRSGSNSGTRARNSRACRGSNIGTCPGSADNCHVV
jgi:hypothetical protein